MGRRAIVAEIIGLAAASLWCGLLLTCGFVAALIFPTMKSLSPQLPGFALYDGDHWRIAAGQFAAPMFGLLAWIQSLLALVIFMSCRIAGRRGMTAHLPSAAFMSALLSGILVYRPMMNLIAGQWAAAAEGHSARAAASALQFAAMHRWASVSISITLILAVASAAACAAALLRAQPIAPAAAAWR